MCESFSVPVRGLSARLTSARSSAREGVEKRPAPYRFPLAFEISVPRPVASSSTSNLARHSSICLLYTSDAADDMQCGDL
eukprot:1376440-Prymnesium_polylepis.1